MRAEALDFSDKATNKCLTYAQKYLFIQVFCLPVIGQDEGDAETIEQAASVNPNGRKSQKDLSAIARQEATKGIDSFRNWYRELDKAQRESIQKDLDYLLDIARMKGEINDRLHQLVENLENDKQ